MLTIHLWENENKLDLIKGGGRFGHVSMTLPPSNGQPALYISWWPDSTGRVELTPTGISVIDRRVKAHESDAVQGRTLHDDLWAEQSGMFETKQLLTLSDSDLKSCQSKVKQESDDSPPPLLPEAVGKLLRARSADKIKLKRCLCGWDDSNSQYVVDDLDANVTYLLFQSPRTKKVKVMQVTGQRSLRQLQVGKQYVKELKEAIEDESSTKQKKALSTLSTDLFKKDIFDQNMGVLPLADRQWLIAGRTKTWYLRHDLEKGTLTLFYWKRALATPDHTYEIPILSKDNPWGLDAQAIRWWWKLMNLADSPKWSTFDANCCVIVLSALKIGGASGYVKPPDQVFLCWTPKDIQEYVEALIKRIKSHGVSSRYTKSDFNPNLVTASRRQLLRIKNQLAFQHTLPSGVNYATATIVWTKQGFIEQTTSSRKSSERSAELKKIDAALDSYHQLPKKLKNSDCMRRVGGLRILSDALADLLLRMKKFNPTFSEIKPIMQLANLVYAERDELQKVVIGMKRKIVNSNTSSSSNTNNTTTTTTTTTQTVRKRRAGLLPTRSGPLQSGS